MYFHTCPPYFLEIVKFLDVHEVWFSYSYKYVFIIYVYYDDRRALLQVSNCDIWRPGVLFI